MANYGWLNRRQTHGTNNRLVIAMAIQTHGTNNRLVIAMAIARPRTMPWGRARETPVILADGGRFLEHDLLLCIPLNCLGFVASSIAQGFSSPTALASTCSFVARAVLLPSLLSLLTPLNCADVVIIKQHPSWAALFLLSYSAGPTMPTIVPSAAIFIPRRHDSDDGSEALTWRRTSTMATQCRTTAPCALSVCDRLQCR